MSRHVSLMGHLTLAIGLACGPPVSAQSVSFQGVGDLPGGIFESVATAVSGDGTVVVGYSRSSTGFKGFRWASGTMSPIALAPNGTFTWANSVSADGSVIVGAADSGGTIYAFRSVDSTLLLLGAPEGSTIAWTQAWGVSPDGQVAVGDMSTSPSTRTFAGRWDLTTPLLLPGDSSSVAFDASEAAQIVVGYTTWGAALWIDNVLVQLPVASGGQVSPRQARAVTPDGRVIVGVASGNAQQSPAFRWASGIVVPLGVLPGDDTSDAYDISADGTVIVGTGTDGTGVFRSVIWTPVSGVQELKTLVEGEFGGNLGNWILVRARSVSTFGTTIVGQGTNPAGDTEGWVLTLRDDDSVADADDNCPLRSNPLQEDSDSDGQGDACDGCPLDPDKVFAGVCGCGFPDTDTDGDGTPDCVDTCPDDPNPAQDECDKPCRITSPTPDCNSNLVPDACELPDNDCNKTLVPDECELFENDCNASMVPDECELGGNDCNGSLIPDECELAGNDCNASFVPDECELQNNDCNKSLIPDECELADNDCNLTLVPDECELVENDCNTNGIPDECDTDCNENGRPDDCDLASGSSLDCDGDSVPDDCEPDEDGDGFIDDCDACLGTPPGLVLDDRGCPAPFGPCCFGSGVCLDETDPTDCKLVSGHYFGDGLLCTSDLDGDGSIGCDDGCPSDPAKSSPGVCGCGVTDDDADADSVSDCIDQCPGTLADSFVNACGCRTVGSCCFDVGVCFDDTTPDECGLIAGFYQGDGAACDEECGFGDADRNGRVDLRDVARLQTCFGGISGEFVDEFCNPFDIDRCGSINLSDATAVLSVLSGPR